MPNSTTGKKRVALNIYLLKTNPELGSSGIWKPEDIVAYKISNLGRKLRTKTEIHAIAGVGNLFIKKPANEISPDWVEFLQQGMADKSILAKLKNKSTSAILVISEGNRQFAIAFGHGRFLLDNRKIEERFGIRAVLNSVSDRISSIDRQTFDASPRLSRTQTVKASSVSDYMIDTDQELLRGLVGLTKPGLEEQLGPVIAGMDSFKTSALVDLQDLRTLLRVALERSESEDYLKQDASGTASPFAWVANLISIKDKEKITELEAIIDEKLQRKDLSSMWLAVPDIIEWAEVSGFSYHLKKSNQPPDPMLDLERFLGAQRENLTVAQWQRKDIAMVMSDGISTRKLNAYKCLYAEARQGSKQFILNNGTWFQVEPSFQASIEQYFSNIRIKVFTKPFIEYDHSGEESYNKDVCSQGTKLALLDRKLIKFGGKHDKIEVCDIYGTTTQVDGLRHEFIHIKRGRSSSTLSHLFNQGFVAASLLVKEEGFIKEVNKQISQQGFTPLPEKFSAKGHEIVFAIIDGPEGKKLDLPFFSKVTLHACGRNIAAYGYDVSLLHIPESQNRLAELTQRVTKKRDEKKSVDAKSKAINQLVSSPGASKPHSSDKGEVAVKYRDPATGATWTGRGRAPAWIAGKDRVAFTV